MKINNMLRTYIAVLILILMGCGKSNSNDDILLSNNEKLAQDIEVQLEHYVSTFQEIHGASVLIKVQDEMPIQFAKGNANIATGEPLTVDHFFRIASITKILTSVILLQLQEEQVLSLEDKISDYLPIEVIGGIHEINGTSYENQITIKQLLNHTSGIDNYVDLDWINVLLQDPQKNWNPTELVAFVKTNGAAHFPPDSGYYYSDTNYVLLGLIIEQLTNNTLHEVYNTRIFDLLDMNETYLEAYETIPTNELCHGYFENEDLSSWNTSSDWGGGGLVSTLNDLHTFLNALIKDELFNEESTIELMKEWMPISGRASYGLGFGLYKILPNADVIGHSGQGFGFTSGLYYYPEKEAFIVLMVNQQATDIDEFEKAVVNSINEYF